MTELDGVQVALDEAGARGAFNLGYAPTEALQATSLAAMADLFAVVVPGSQDIAD